MTKKQIVDAEVRAYVAKPKKEVVDPEDFDDLEDTEDGRGRSPF